jgi:hypothetical protein
MTHPGITSPEDVTTAVSSQSHPLDIFKLTLDPEFKLTTPVADRSNSLWHRSYQIPPQDKSIEQCRSHGADHRAYGWIPQYDPRWSPEQKEAYWAGYEPLTPSA